MPTKKNAVPAAPGEGTPSSKGNQAPSQLALAPRKKPARKQKGRSRTVSARSGKPRAARTAKAATQSARETVSAGAANPVKANRVRIGDAMRQSGLDEFKVAATFANVVDKLSGKTKGDGGVQKLLVDVLKECSKHLDPPHAERDARDTSGPITLIHCVPRPDRSPRPTPQLDAAPAGTVLEVKPVLEEAP